MLQTSENYNNIQEPTKKNLEDISQCKLHDKICHLFHGMYNTNCKTEYAIYLMECIICNLWYVVKNETPFNIRLNNHRKDVKDPSVILAGKHFQKKL